MKVNGGNTPVVAGLHPRHSHKVSRISMKIIMALMLVTLAHAEEKTELWPVVPFKHVVGYCYDFSQDPRGTQVTFPDGSLHRGVIRATTVRLDDTQARKLRKLLSEHSGEERGDVDCYDPHHAFVFYDESWKVAASIDICFLCDNYEERPKGVSETIDLRALDAFCRELGLPMYEESSEYTKLFMQEQPQGGAPALEKEIPASGLDLSGRANGSSKAPAPEKEIPARENDDPFASDE